MGIGSHSSAMMETTKMGTDVQGIARSRPAISAAWVPADFLPLTP